MKKSFFYLIMLLAGILNGYLLILLAGYTYPMDLFVWTIQKLKEYKLLCLGDFISRVIATIHFAIIAIPIFMLSGYILTYSLKSDPITMGWVSSISMVLFLLIISTMYSAGLFDFLMEVAVSIILNMLILIKMSKMFGDQKNA